MHAIRPRRSILGAASSRSGVVGVPAARSARGPRSRAFAIAVVCTSLTMGALAQPRMVPIGPLPGGTDSSAIALSADRRSVTGTSTITGGRRRAFRWSDSGELIEIGILPDASAAVGQAISADGSVVAGYCDTPTGRRAFRWDAANRMRDLGVLPGGTTASAQAVSADGTVVVGYAGTPTGVRAFRWTAATGMQPLEAAFPVRASRALAMSTQGQVIAGFVDLAEGARAFRWTSAGGMQLLGVLPGWTDSYGANVSADGEAIVGHLAGPDGLRAMRWTIAGGMEGLDVPPGGAFPSLSYSLCVSDDASIVLGESYTPATRYRSFRWTPVRGATDLLDYLGSLSVNTLGFDALVPRGISSDGTAIVGDGITAGVRRGFLVRGLPRIPRPCIADMDDGSGTGRPDGGVTIDDLRYFIEQYNVGAPRADVDDGSLSGLPDNGVTIDDLLYYLTRFAGGC